MTYQIAGAAEYWRLSPWLASVRVIDVEPPALLKTSAPAAAAVTVLLPPWMTCLTASRVPLGGADGSVTVNEPPVVLHGTNWPAAAV